jgi:hypothetical protein
MQGTTTWCRTCALGMRTGVVDLSMDMRVRKVISRTAAGGDVSFVQVNDE